MNQRVLVVDDNPVILEEYRKVLAPWVEDGADLPYEIDTALQGVEAVAMAAQAVREGRPYAVAFVDARMPPGIDGVETIRQLWAVDPSLQVVITLGDGNYGWQDIAGALKPTDNLLVLQKPSELIEIRQMACTLCWKWSVARRWEAECQSVDNAVVALRAEVARNVSVEDQLRTAVARLYDSSASKDRLFGMIAHDLRGPLHNLERMTGLLSTETSSLSPYEIQSFAIRVNDAADRLRGILDNLVQWATWHAGSQKIRPEQVDLLPVVSGVLRSLGADFAQFGVRCSNDIPVGFCVRADPAMTAAMVHNLLVNALRFAGRDGRVRILAAASGGWAEISVFNDGEVLSEAAQAQLFDGKGHIRIDDSGAGFGLLLTHAFVSAHGGQLSVRSHQDQGTTFTFTLPLATPAAESAADGTPESLRILVVEDDDLQQDITRIMLGRLGFAADLVWDGTEAVRAAEQRNYDLILMDVHMPQMSGIDATRTIVGQVDGARRPRIVGLTGDDTERCRRLCLDAGMVEVCPKDLTPEDLGTVIRKWALSS